MGKSFLSFTTAHIYPTFAKDLKRLDQVRTLCNFGKNKLT